VKRNQEMIISKVLIVFAMPFVFLSDLAFATQDLAARRQQDWRATSEIEYLYKAESGRRVDVFNLTRRYTYLESDDYLDRRDGRHDTEFAGQIMYCVRTKYFCIRGGIYAVVPRVISGQTDWAFRDVTCHARTRLSDVGINEITCTFRGSGTAFKYEQKKGIISYSDTGAEATEFKLVGSRGLFGAPIK
jgi:hypothetical protein